MGKINKESLSNHPAADGMGESVLYGDIYTSDWDGEPIQDVSVQVGIEHPEIEDRFSAIEDE